MDDLEQLCECHVIKSTLSIGIGIEVLGFWPVLVLVLVLKISFNQELVLVLVLTLCPLRVLVLVLVLTLGLSEVLVLVWPNWYCLCLLPTVFLKKDKQVLSGRYLIFHLSNLGKKLFQFGYL